jgi:hypothetical protein
LLHATTSSRRTTSPSSSLHQSGCGCALMSPRPRRAQKAQLERFIFAATNLITERLPNKNGILFEDDPQFKKYKTDADRWLNDTSTWILENLGEKAQQQFLDISHTELFGNDGPESVNQTHLNIMLNLRKWRENLIVMARSFYTGENAK